MADPWIEQPLLEGRHVLFMEDGGSAYLKKLFAVLA